jgi:hypothetical protein
MTLRTLACALAALTLSACGQPQQDGAPAAPSDGSVTLGSAQSLPDWLLVARQRDCRGETPAEERECIGEVHFNQRTITRNTADGTADIWIQVRHAQPQLFEMESATTETLIRFTNERLHYRFQCRETDANGAPLENFGHFIVVERQIMGEAEVVIARDEPTPIYRAPIRGSVTGIIQPIACRGS